MSKGDNNAKEGLRTIQVSFLVNVPMKGPGGIAMGKLTLAIKAFVERHLVSGASDAEYEGRFRHRSLIGDQTPEGWFSLDIKD